MGQCSGRMGGTGKRIYEIRKCYLNTSLLIESPGQSNSPRQRSPDSSLALA